MSRFEQTVQRIRQQQMCQSAVVADSMLVEVSRDPTDYIRAVQAQGRRQLGQFIADSSGLLNVSARYCPIKRGHEYTFSTLVMSPDQFDAMVRDLRSAAAHEHDESYRKGLEAGIRQERGRVLGILGMK